MTERLTKTTQHPTERCPTCSKPALMWYRCRCNYYCIQCEDDHHWHRCPTHRVLVVGRTDHRTPCTCPPYVYDPSKKPRAADHVNGRLARSIAEEIDRDVLWRLIEGVD